ncbi:MAG: HAD-IA family hydrolase, partial [Devosiaceae bacterium]|nr:HAD-IA family hydrolase [Devosiaceae bacterium]
YPGVISCLETLKKHGFKLGVCTNKPEAPARVILDGLELTRFFDVIVGGDTYPSLKPDPTPLHGCAEKLGSTAALYVGDSETDALTATNAKMEFALYSGGYRNTPTREMAHDFLFDHFDQFTEFALKK